jgi:hypothetical protein
MTGSLIATTGVPVVVSQWPANEPGDLTRKGRLRSLALVLRADILTSDGVPVREAFAEGIKKFREIVRAKKKSEAEEVTEQCPK